MELQHADTVTILGELGRRLRRERLNANISQQLLATRAGVSRRTVQKTESGSSSTLETWVRLLRALGRLDALDALLPDPGTSPVELARRQGAPRQRSSASSKTTKAGQQKPKGKWQW